MQRPVLLVGADVIEGQPKSRDSARKIWLNEETIRLLREHRTALHPHRGASPPGRCRDGREAGRGSRIMNGCSPAVPRGTFPGHPERPGCGTPSRPGSAFAQVAEADGNRTRRRRSAPSTSFEVRAHGPKAAKASVTRRHPRTSARVRHTRRRSPAEGGESRHESSMCQHGAEGLTPGWPPSERVTGRVVAGQRVGRVGLEPTTGGL